MFQGERSLGSTSVLDNGGQNFDELARFIEKVMDIWLVALDSCRDETGASSWFRRARLKSCGAKAGYLDKKSVSETR
jgi:hypothetical protein